MDLSNLKPAKGAVKKSKRVGRGQGSGKGRTSARGHKGAKSRSGNKKKLGHEGGQMPLSRRLPKYGFNNISRKEFKGINLDVLQQLVDAKGLTSIDVKTLYENGMVGKKDLVKILGRGELKAKVDVTAHAFSQTAMKAIEAAGGSAQIMKA